MSKKVQKNLHTEQHASSLHTPQMNNFIFEKGSFVSFSQPSDINYYTPLSTSLCTKNTFVPLEEAPSLDVRLSVPLFINTNTGTGSNKALNNLDKMWNNLNKIGDNLHKVYDTMVGLPFKILHAVATALPSNTNHHTSFPAPLYTKNTFVPSKETPLPDTKTSASPFFKMSVEIDTEKVLDTVIGLPLDILRAGVTVTQCGVAFAKPFLAGALLGDLLPKTIGEAIILAPIEKIIPIETYAIAAGTVIALDLASTGMDWVLNDTFLSDCSYFW